MNNIFSDLTDKERIYISKVLKRYLMGIIISKNNGNILYEFQIDPSIKIDLFSQFIAALAMFGDELVNIKRIIIEGLNIEMSSLMKHGIIITAFFKPDMVKDYLETEAEQCLDEFYEAFKSSIESNRGNLDVYKKFDNRMWALIQAYLIRLGFFDLNYLNFMR
jgi:hypothetical protein